MDSSTQLLVNMLISLAGAATTIIGTMIAWKKMRADSGSQERKDKREDHLTEVQAAGQATNSILLVNASLKEALKDCYGQLEDQSRQRIKLNNIRIHLSNIIDMAHELLADIEKNQTARKTRVGCNAHAELVGMLLEELETLYKFTEEEERKE